MKKIFLQWCIVNVITICIVVPVTILSNSQVGDINIVAKIMLGAIGIVFLATDVYSGILCWKSDKLLEMGHKGMFGIESDKKLKELKHAADHISYAANECPYIGFLGAVTGIYFMMSLKLSDISDADHLKEGISESLKTIGIAFIPTIAGIFGRIILNWQHHIIIHTLDKRDL